MSKQQIASGLGCLASFVFFLVAYPYHLVRREQMDLFVYDWDYIAQTFSGMGWLSRLAGSFAEQFFCIPVLGALIVALLLTALGTVAYRISRKFLGERISLLSAALIYIWSFLRECNGLYLTRYTIATLGFLVLVLLSLQFRKTAGKVISAVLFLCIGVWALGAPCNSTYGKPWGFPRMDAERLAALEVETTRENWDRVIELSRKDLHNVEASACYNLAKAMKGQLGNGLLDHSQGAPFDFLLSVSGDNDIFTNGIAGEQWYQLGDLTAAEQSAITCLQASPEHTGARFIERMARVNIITGQTATAQKYLGILSKTLFYGKWAVRMLDGTMSEEDEAWIARVRAKLVTHDRIYVEDIKRSTLHGLLEANPGNTPAREYLLCYDLLRYDLEQFMEDYEQCRLDARIYKEAVIIWLGQNGISSEEVLDGYGIDEGTKQRMISFFRYPNNYGNTYWYYYQKAQN